MESGKWDEETQQNERDCRQTVKALINRHVTVLYVTHLYHFARSVSGEKIASALFLRAESLPMAPDPFKFIAEPSQTSHGEE